MNKCLHCGHEVHDCDREGQDFRLCSRYQREHNVHAKYDPQAEAKAAEIRRCTPLEPTARRDFELAELKAGDEFRQSIKDRAVQAARGVAWHGWAIMDAFRAGAKWQREQRPDLKDVHALVISEEAARGAVELMRQNFTGFGVCGDLRPVDDIRITASNVVVDSGYHWQPMSTCPVNSKVQLLGKGGMPGYGKWDGKNDFYVGWAPIPTRAPA